MKALLRYSVLIFFLGWNALLAGAAGPVRLKTVVIDPGHGGHDPGCVSRDETATTEKSVTLDIATRLRDKILAQYPEEVNVILTRDDDTYVTLSGRADAANNANADLFISIHINSTAGGPKASGYSVHCLGQSSKQGNDLFSKNLELCQRENSVIKLEEDYETKYQGFDPTDPQSYIFFSLLQNSNLNMSLAFAEDVAEAMKAGPVKHNRGVSQDPFWVLWRTTMPSVLIECAFITNPGDLATLRSEEGRDGIAQCILNAFVTYKNRYEGSTSGNEKPKPPVQEVKPDTTHLAKPDTLQAAKPEVTPAVLYGTQVIATPKALAADDAFFRGYTPVVIPGEKLSRYVIGTSESLEDARKKNEEIRKFFTDSFMVRIEGNSTERIR